MEEILPHLPDNVRQLWDALRDTRQLWRVLHAYGGQTCACPGRNRIATTLCAAVWACAACASSWPL